MIEPELGNVNIIGLSVTVLLSIMILILPRRYAPAPMILIAFYMTLGQMFIIGGLHFPMERVMIFFGWVRIVMRGEIRSIRFNRIDKAIIIWVISSVAAYTLLRQDSDAFIYRAGFAYNVFGLYFFFRAVIREWDDIVRLIKVICICVVPLSLFLLLEKATGKNPFFIFGGVPIFSDIRDGSVRCQGPFRHPILAGTLGATLLPLFLGRWFSAKTKRLSFSLGIVAAGIIIIAPASSGPLVAAVSGVIAVGLWPFRANMRMVKWVALLALIFLHLIMNAPFWYIIARASDLIGGTGWHRAYLIDMAIAHFDEWWLIGTKVTGHWMPYTLRLDPTSADITNQFIWEGVNGGLITMILFVLIIGFCYQAIGKAIRTLGYKPSEYNRVLWSLGAALFAHNMSFFSVVYFDQIIVFWYMLLATIASVPNLFSTQLAEAHATESEA